MILESDNDYGEGIRILHSTSTIAIDVNTPLLLLLSLVDTFECVKKLSKGENETNFLKTISVLSSISLSVTEQELVIDFSKLLKRIQDKRSRELESTYRRYKENLLKLDEWASFAVDKSDNEVIKIRMKSKRNLSNQSTLDVPDKELAYV